MVSHCSTNPADLDVVSSVQGRVVSVMVNVVPLPTSEVIVAASYAAVSAVAVTTFAQPFFDTIKKKIQKFIQGKIDKWKKRKKD